ncbi:MAG: (d)CMP kinase [Gammaproteobacteria bacterium]|nr:(d)CMP kinase [Gammaproteobacteria bacterium]
MSTPVITVDGPSGAGKGTVAHQLSRQLGWHLLDSGALYRVTAYACTQEGVDLADHAGVAAVARRLQVDFVIADNGEVLVYYREQDASRAIRTEAGGRGASTVGTIPAVREALLARQRDFLQAPGLVADGRDMGTVVFPSAPLKFFLVASAEERAERRYKQLIDKGESVNLARLLRDIEERDERDSSRSISPLVPADDAIVIDSTATPIAAVFAKVMADVHRIFPEL